MLRLLGRDFLKMQYMLADLVIDMYVECGCITQEKRSLSVHLFLLTFRPVQGV